MACHSSIFALISGSFHTMIIDDLQMVEYMSEMSNSFNSVYRRMGNGQVGDGGNAMEEENSRINLISEFIQEREGAFRVKWFLHSLEACKMIRYEHSNGGNGKNK